jgi:polyferredoxin
MVGYRKIRLLRRLSQTFFFALFVWLLLATFYHGVVETGEGVNDRIPYPVSAFLQFDPLAALATLFATGKLYEDLFRSLAVIVLTLLLGRFACGWVCPLGALNNAFSETGVRRKTARRIAANKPGRRQKLKYVVLFFFLGAALAGTVQIGLLDPICLMVRSLGLSILPAAGMTLRSAFNILPEGGEAATAAHSLLDDYFLGPQSLRFHGSWVIGVIFVVIVWLNRLEPRFFCRILCPLGALFGLLSRFSLLNLHKNGETCKNCGLCARACQGAASPEGGVDWKSAECQLCFNCVADCPQSSIGFGFFARKGTRDAAPCLSRRGFLASGVAGAALLPLSRSSSGPPRDISPMLIRPPGSCGEEDFLDRCIKCGQCMKVCPNNAVHPTAFQAGLEGVWTPVIIPRIGYCEPSCTLCSQVCPTGAIRPFTAEDKKANRVRIGTAFFDRDVCLPWAQGKTCMVCEEFCPTSPKAIWFEKKRVSLPDGKSREIPLPRVEPDHCTGCGGCEMACPVPDRGGILVTSCGESRSPENRALL